MFRNLPTSSLFEQRPDFLLPGLVLNHVIFGFHNNQMRVLLLQFKNSDGWLLPGGYVFNDEDVDAAAARILASRTGLSDLFLQPFGTFGRAARINKVELRQRLEAAGANLPPQSWVLDRSVSLGYYALADYVKTTPQVTDEFSVCCAWHELTNLPLLLFDHGEILDGAWQALRVHLNFQPIGYNLLPSEFALKSLQTIYETILGRRLERSNFNRKILSYGILERKEKFYSGAANKAPYLYSFNKDAYFRALQTGFEKGF